MKMCLIGSTRFMENYVLANRELTLKGHVVYTVATISTQSAMKDTASSPITPAEKEVLDLVHLRKIQESETVVLITDETGYYGDSTRREMIWASMLCKPIMVFVPTKPQASVFQWGGMFGRGDALNIPSFEKLAEGWKATVEAEAEDQRMEALHKAGGIVVPGGEA